MILHVDGDAFFVGCELTRRPDLRGQPVVTGAERGIASAMSYEAKALGVTRGYPIFKLRKDFPQVVVLPGDYELYEQYAERMYKIVRRYADVVEEYSIDECFGLLASRPPSAVGTLVRKIQTTLMNELGVSFSIGCAPTKVLAKLASKRDKPGGAVFASKETFSGELYHMPLEKVWGIGRRSLPLFRVMGVETVGDFAARSEAWVKENWNINMLELWRELRGESVYKVAEGNVGKHLSIQKTRTFGPASGEFGVLFAQLAKNIENAFGYARSLARAPLEASFFIKSEKFKYRVDGVKFALPVETPEELLKQVRERLPRLIRRGEKYRATGVTLFNFAQPDSFRDIFGDWQEARRRTEVHGIADSLYDKYGGRVLTIASALPARTQRPGRSRSAPGAYSLGRVQTSRLNLGLPYLGEVR